MNKIPISKPSITAKEIDYVNDAVTNGWGPNCYDYLIKFQKEFASYIDSDFSIATSSCTGAIHLAFLAIGLKKDDEVICPDITWIASVSPITYIGAKPIFVDIERDSWCIDPKKIEEAITPRTKAIMPVHLYGNVCKMDEIMEIARKHNLYVIEDAAEGLGSEYKGKKCGSIGDIGVFSFHGTKVMTTGEGGMLVTNNKQIHDEASVFNDHGRSQKNPKMFWMESIGYKYKMSNIQAALGLAQVERMDDLVNRKREIFSNYKHLLASVKDIELNNEPAETKNSFWMPTIVLGTSYNIDREDLFSYLKDNLVDYRPFFYPLSSLPMFQDKIENSVSYSIFKKAFHLPTFHDMTLDDQIRVVNLLKEYLGKK